MKLRSFVYGFSLILVGWLALTFVVHVPAPHYQKPEGLPATVDLRHPAADLTVTATTKTGAGAISRSR